MRAVFRIALALAATATVAATLGERRVSSSCRTAHSEGHAEGDETGYLCEFGAGNSWSPAESCWSTDGRIWCTQPSVASANVAGTVAAGGDGSGAVPGPARRQMAEAAVELAMLPAYEWTIFVIIIILIVLSVFFEQLKDIIEDHAGPDMEKIVAQMVPLPILLAHGTPPRLVFRICRRALTRRASLVCGADGARFPWLADVLGHAS